MISLTAEVFITARVRKRPAIGSACVGAGVGVRDLTGVVELGCEGAVTMVTVAGKH
jgi:hypothetical protein